MNINFHKNFIKHFKLRIEPNPALAKKFQERLDLFIQDRNHLTLKDHQLIGSKSGYRAFSITGNIRVVYKQFSEEILLYDIGTHIQVYNN